jgi:hypothetical protein
MSSVDYYYNSCIPEILLHKLRINININAIKIIVILFVYSNFDSFAISFLHIKSPKYTIFLNDVFNW